MAELRIQPKKKSPSPWLLVALAVLVLGAAAYFFLRPDPIDEPAPAAAPVTAAPADTLVATAPDTAAAPAATSPANDSSIALATTAAGGAGATLLLLSPQLTQLADRADLRDDDLVVLIPAFVSSELTRAFEIGFLLYIPFLVVDLLVSNVLMAMGMSMVSPTLISIPLKIFLFVALSGWSRLMHGLILSYGG